MKTIKQDQIKKKSSKSGSMISYNRTKYGEKVSPQFRRSVKAIAKKYDKALKRLAEK